MINVTFYVRQLVDFTRHSHKREGVIEDKNLFRIWESRFKCVFDNSRICKDAAIGRFELFQFEVA